MERANKRELEPLLTVDEACEILKISVPTFYRLRKDGDLRAVRVGGRLRLHPQDLRDFIKRNASESTDDA